MPAHDLELLTTAAREAGRIASGFSGKDARRWDKPGGAGPVTEADLAVNAYLEETLLTARPDYGWLSEENEDDAARLGKDQVFIVDPIDGTRSFAEGSRTWAIAIATAEAGVISSAAVYLPLRDKLYTAARGAGAFLNGAPLQVSGREALGGAKVLSAKPNFQPKNWRSGTPPEMERHYRPSLAYRLALVAEGRFDAMITLRGSWEWDIAAGALLVAEAGGRITDRNGKVLQFNSPSACLNGIVAGGVKLHTDLADALAPHDA